MISIKTSFAIGGPVYDMLVATPCTAKIRPASLLHNMGTYDAERLGTQHRCGILHQKLQVLSELSLGILQTLAYIQCTLSPENNIIVASTVRYDEDVNIPG
jgi:hypothetical protein